MPPSPTSRRLLRALAAATLVLAIYAFLNAGRFLTREDPLRKADAVLVLAGTEMDRPLEAADLYREGWASRIVLTYGLRERSLDELIRRGVTVPSDEDIARDLLVRSGIPATAILLPPRVHDNTAQEAQTFRELAVQNGWRRVIVVTSRYHLRRAGFAIRRELSGTGVEVTMRGSRYDVVNPDRWWMSRADLRWMMSEAPKLAAYTLGLGA